MSANNNLWIRDEFDYYEKLNKHVIKGALEKLKSEYEFKDKEIFNSSWRKKRGYIPHGTRTKVLVTIFGKINYSRHRYKIWENERYRFVYLADIALGIEKYQRITTHLQLKIMSLVGEGKRYQDILDCFPNIKLKTSTIARIIRRTNVYPLKTVIENFIRPLEIKKCLYINLDDTFVTLKINNKKQKVRIRTIVFHDGYDLERSTNNKKVLKNVRIFAFIIINQEVNTAHFNFELKKIASLFYSNVDEVPVIISGDGAPWIRESCKYWKNSKYVLDKFHAIRKIRQTFSPKNLVDTICYQHLKTLFLEGKYFEIEKFLENKINSNKSNFKIRQLKTYFYKNEQFQGITNQSDKANIGCTIESAISHNIKRLLGSGSKAFSKEIFLKMLYLHLSKINGFDMINQIKKQILIKNKENLDFLFDIKIQYNSKKLISNANISE